MTTLQRYAPRATTMREVERWIRSVMPRSTPASSPVPRVLAGLALVLAGAAAALLLSPVNGAEMRKATGKRLKSMRKTATDFAASHDPRINGRASQSPAERAPRREATS